MYRIIFESVSSELSVVADSFEMETDTYDEIVLTIDYFRHIACLDVDRDDYVDEIRTLIERERLGKSTREDERRFEQLDKKRDKSHTYKYCKLNIYLLRGSVKDLLLSVPGGMACLPELPALANCLELPVSVLATIHCVNPVWRQMLSERLQAAPGDVSRLARAAAAAPTASLSVPAVKAEEKQNVDAQDIDFTDLPDLPMVANTSDKSNSNQSLAAKKGKKGKK